MMLTAPRGASRTADGEQIRSKTPVDRVPDAGTVRVAYVPGDPQRVKVVGNWRPAYTWGPIVIGVALLFIPVFLGLGALAKQRGKAL